MTFNSTKQLLTIAIPTYNRCQYLRQCLSTLMPQVAVAAPYVKVLVIDNNSTDNTADIAADFQAQYPAYITIMRNKENIGADANIANCFAECTTTYAWVFGDDDVLMPGALATLLAKINECEYGVIHLCAFSYVGSVEACRPHRTKGRYEVFNPENVENMLYEVSDMFSFITGNIVNKSLVPADIDIHEFLWTRYNQIQWVFGALFAGHPNLLIDDALLAINNDGNSGGYPFCKIFGTNFNVLFRAFEHRGLPTRYFDTINRRMARELFAPLIYFARKDQGFRNYMPEDHFGELKPNFSKYWEFWVFVAPMCKLPKILLYPHFFGVRILNRIYRYVR